ncbi:hypothetical protein PDIDSM_1144 [Penicillium digitatum]|nr:hypothetical protein PDIDSM_1144 [Penicillium digitatum]
MRGEAGTQLGNAAWELYLLEHGPKPDEFIDPDVTNQDAKCGSNETFFTKTSGGKSVPRSIFVDLDPLPIDEIRTGPFRGLSALSNARGHYTVEREISEAVIDSIRHVAGMSLRTRFSCRWLLANFFIKNCHSLQGFLTFHSFGGGTGSGFGSLLLDHLTITYGRKSKLGFSIYPSPRTSNAVVEPHNAVLSTHSTIENSDCTFLVDNDAVYDICRRNLDMNTSTV